MTGSIARLVAATTAFWPEHAPYLKRTMQSLAPDLTRHADRVAGLVLRIADGDPGRMLTGYRWLCEMILAEELDFRRSGAYRHSRFAEVDAALYQRDDLMPLYLDGLLLSQALWSNHIATSHFLAHGFLPRLDPGGRFLEIGPGHGLLLTLLAGRAAGGAVEGWDISPTSVAMTGDCLRRLGVESGVALHVRDLFAAGGEGGFDAVVLSEILEHLEDPVAALRHAGRLLAPGGLVFVNVPTNAPTLDHIHLLRSCDEAAGLLLAAGFEILERCLAPSGGYGLDRAIKAEATISCAFIARLSFP